MSIVLNFVVFLSSGGSLADLQQLQHITPVTFFVLLLTATGDPRLTMLLLMRFLLPCAPSILPHACAHPAAQEACVPALSSNTSPQ
jgi:hypothetical protein